MYIAKLNECTLITITIRNTLRRHGRKFPWNPRKTPMLFQNLNYWESNNNTNQPKNEEKVYSYNKLIHHVQLQASLQQWHTHTFTCKKGFNGHTGCRLCKPSGLSHGTKPYLLTSKQIENIDNEFIDVEYSIDEIETIYNSSEINEQEYYPINPTSMIDNPLIVWELDRPLLQQKFRIQQLKNTTLSQLNYDKQKTHIMNLLAQLNHESENRNYNLPYLQLFTNEVQEHLDKKNS